MESKPQDQSAVKNKIPSENRATLSGRVESVIEIPRKEPGKRGVRFLLSVGDPDGKRPNTFNCLAWDELAIQVIGLPADSLVRITGRLKRSTWMDKATDTRRYDTEIVVSSIEVLQ